uniref:NADH dehydrogenase subunit 6 n=1 Tax=Haemadipsa tianmushana TaxID=2301367 RepID=A0A8F9WKF5_9ANNE|nr:NADH dehydrogenase subunit 6 [Haemadipsa tianmushana]
MFLIFGLSMNLFIISSPVMMLLVILFNSLLLSLIIAFNLSSWYAFLMFLIYIGGMLVMFSYFVAISPNQKLKMKLMFFTPTFIMLIMLLYYFNSNYISTNMYSLSNILMMYKNESSICTMFLILLLMLMMLMVSKMMKLSKGPLRPFMYVFATTKK